MEKGQEMDVGKVEMLEGGDKKDGCWRGKDGNGG